MISLKHQMEHLNNMQHLWNKSYTYCKKQISEQISENNILGNSKLIIHWQTQNINIWIVSGTPNTYFMWLLLNHGSMTDERDPSTFYKVSSYFAHKLQYIKALKWN
jgi:hypothetical protein